MIVRCARTAMMSSITMSHHTENSTSNQRAKNTASFGCPQVPTRGRRPLPRWVSISSLSLESRDKTFLSAFMYSLVVGETMKLSSFFPKCFAAFVMFR